MPNCNVPRRWDDGVADIPACGLGEADYLRAAQDLLPWGVVWSREAGSVMTRFWSAVAAECARIDAAICRLFNEADPRTSLDLLPDWERVVGIPDDCLTRPADLAARRRLVVAKLTMQGGQSIPWFTELAGLLGFQIDIQEQHPLTAGCGGVNAPVGGCPFWWIVHVRCQEPGSSRAELECLIRRFKPAHSKVSFVYNSAARVC